MQVTSKKRRKRILPWDQWAVMAPARKEAERVRRIRAGEPPETDDAELTREMFQRLGKPWPHLDRRAEKQRLEWEGSEHVATFSRRQRRSELHPDKLGREQTAAEREEYTALVSR